MENIHKVRERSVKKENGRLQTRLILEDGSVVELQPGDVLFNNATAGNLMLSGFLFGVSLVGAFWLPQILGRWIGGLL
jgi:hypothetical protein